jgi:hypothetical protein
MRCWTKKPSSWGLRWVSSESPEKLGVGDDPTPSGTDKGGTGKRRWPWREA